MSRMHTRPGVSPALQALLQQAQDGPSGQSRHVSPPARPSRGAPPTDRALLSQADCQAITERLSRAVNGRGFERGFTAARLWSDWVAGVRWGRNQILSAQASTDSTVNVSQIINGAESGWIITNEVTDDAVAAAAERAVLMTGISNESLVGDLQLHRPLDAPPMPALFDEATYQQQSELRVAVATQLIQQAVDAGMYSAGYLEVSAHSLAIMDTVGRTSYFRYTWAQCSLTVRDPAGTGSGWAGVDWPAWGKINPTELGKIALDKCLKSRNPVRVEPGRYTTILEPQAVFDIVSSVFGEQDIDYKERTYAETNSSSPFFKSSDPSGLNFSKLGETVTDTRLTISSDILDPELGTSPFSNVEQPFQDYLFYSSVTFVKNGVLTELPYQGRYGAKLLGRKSGLGASGAFRMTGGTTSIADMIASTAWGLLVTRLDSVQMLTPTSGLVRGYTRDGDVVDRARTNYQAGGEFSGDRIGVLHIEQHRADGRAAAHL